jgi:hypothetical protein
LEGRRVLEFQGLGFREGRRVLEFQVLGFREGRRVLEFQVLGFRDDLPTQPQIQIMCPSGQRKYIRPAN